MSGISILREDGSFRLIERGGRFAVVELRCDHAYPLDPARRNAEGYPATPEGLGRAAEGSWMEREQAEALFEEIRDRGEELARDLR